MDKKRNIAARLVLLVVVLGLITVAVRQSLPRRSTESNAPPAITSQRASLSSVAASSPPKSPATKPAEQGVQHTPGGLTASDEIPDWSSPEEEASLAEVHARKLARLRAKGITVPPSEYVVELPDVADPGRDFTADHCLAECINPRPGETPELFKDRLWGFYADQGHRRYRGQILIRISKALREAGRFGEAIQTLRMAQNLHAEATYFDWNWVAAWFPAGESSRDPSGGFRALAQHYTANPDKTGEWALLEMARTYSLQGRVDLASEVLNDMISRHPDSTYRESDLRFLRDTARPLTQEGESKDVIGWTPWSPDRVDRPEDVALHELLGIAGRSGDLKEAYRLARLEHDSIEAPASYPRVVDVAALAYNAGFPSEAVTMLENWRNACDTVLREGSASTTPRGLEEWSKARALIDSALSRVRDGAQWLSPRIVEWKLKGPRPK